MLQSLLSNGNGIFQSQITYRFGACPHSVAADDVNHDTHMNTVVADSLFGYISIYCGYDNESFTMPKYFATDMCRWAVAIGDFSRDSRLNIVAAHADTNVDILFNMF
ncbi:unnamed protein product [Rotaria sp. Silwood1]|nr:unnamed protein product [Rotaria sp. Silwood1]CAF1193673.1 unnamed protein product [Rotaria sp. Silwood1]CAF3455893.1 unnamed protein product [Rotaria sp. Silwood1]CAF3467715.1 unnamed protein product [Rotaria sp. Silwood1]CAF3505519.1 unnamed protein product [Rotaria sp. Silwood1]